MKTMKDILLYTTPQGNNYSGGYVLGNELRTEAIKWIRQLQKELELARDLNLFEKCSSYQKMEIIGVREEHPAQIKWIKHFFNISDELIREKVEREE